MLKKNSLPGRYGLSLKNISNCYEILFIELCYQGHIAMSKRELIDCICEINRSAKPEFLATFSEQDLTAYLEHLMELDLQRLAVTC